MRLKFFYTSNTSIQQGTKLTVKNPLKKVSWALFTSGIKMSFGQSDHEWTTPNTRVNGL